MNRLAAMQAWPHTRIRAVSAAVQQSSRRASARTTNGSDPPSSMTAFLMWAPARAPTAAPARAEPVRVTPRTARWATASGTSPVSTRSTRSRFGGNPASVKSPSRAMATPVTLGACLTARALPAARIGAAARMTCQKGKFQGMTARMTPRGSWTTMRRPVSDGAGASASQQGAILA